ncbi:hypothetical protein UFOVP1437_22 [uncultured Caudovirales phage]|uniref:Uncharacterized protein n=1 Tax=uncultured Caudovirales phage TaxID=2100421 RepID=A0A6J5SDP8_9CAUD|nr:hypothetical protein UFOVP1437_22 [uncultured Caudovirales phage]CAB5228148.1 hypothetical protein UFOVP1531_42 [uncultured Caudovirales phage]
MGKIVSIGEVKEIKPLPVCPLSAYTGMVDSACRHMGLSITPAYSDAAISIAVALNKHHKKFKNPPREYVIVDTVTLLATIPLYNSKILRCTANTLTSTLDIVDERSIENDMSCYNLTVYYNHVYPDLFIHTENLHDGDVWE